jgi:hypothetical protein
MTAKKGFFEFAAALLFMLAGLLIGAALFVVLLVAAICTVIFGAARWFASFGRAFASDFSKGFWKAVRSDQEKKVARLAPEGAGLPGDSLPDRKPEEICYQRGDRKWLQ